MNGIAFKGSDLEKSYGWNALQKRGLSYEQDRDGEALRERARRAFGLPRPENIVYRWVIGVPFQTVSNMHWLCTCIDQGPEPRFAA